MRALVTGAAGFIGSSLSDVLVARGDTVVGVDSLTPYYDRALKCENLEALLASRRFEFVEGDLLELDLRSVLSDVDVVFHQAGQPGVRHSWAEGYIDYEMRNVVATQRLLEAAKGSFLQRFVYASSSSIYGDAESYPTTEETLPRPRSPYGVTKLAAEHLCGLYASNYSVPTVSLRYFTVYGPRQRPDMAFHRLIEAALEGTPFALFGDGTQVRDFTYVGDVVEANLKAAEAELARGTVLNVAGGSQVPLSDVIDSLRQITGRPIEVVKSPVALGDVRRTGGSTDLAARLLGWAPEVGLEEGLRVQVRWHEARRPGAESTIVGTPEAPSPLA
jgi:nucleoside-diphosphate-sugar epimerase